MTTATTAEGIRGALIERRTVTTIRPSGSCGRIEVTHRSSSDGISVQIFEVDHESGAVTSESGIGLGREEVDALIAALLEASSLRSRTGTP